MGRRNSVRRKPPNSKRFVWFFGYHVFDLEAARALCEKKTTVQLPTVQIAALLEDGSVDTDSVPRADVGSCGILARVPIGEGRDRYILIDGYEAAEKCRRAGRTFGVRVLTRNEARQVRIAADSLGEWPD